MGTIRYVVDQRLLRAMALKELRDGIALSSNRARRFVEEAQITGQLDHPNVVPVHQFGQDDDGAPFFTMKLVRGQTLADVLAELGPRRFDALSLERLVRHLVKVCDALAFAHTRGVVHRDIKPNNLMIGSHGQVYVMDWGLALLRGRPRLASDEGKIVGTPGYMAPEQTYDGSDQVDERADIYALGVVLYIILTGRRPHLGRRAELIESTRAGAIEQPQSVMPDTPLPPELCRICLKALSTAPGDRHASMDALKGELEQFLRGGGWIQTRDYPAGSLIVREGDVGDEAYIIVAGACEAFKIVDGERLSLREMSGGDVFGETAVLTDKPRTASVVATVDTTLKVVTRDALERELARCEWLDSFVRVLARRFREVDEKVSRQAALLGGNRSGGKLLGGKPSGK